jgi:transcriptional regulator of arginine metabolism
VKRQRQAALLDAVRREPLGSQEQIRTRLGELGYDATQSTISRDLEELGLVRVRDGDGHLRYAELADAGSPNGNHHAPSLQGLLREFALAVETSGNLVLVKTPPGAANAVAQGLDTAPLHGLLGTVAGDDTILVVAKSGPAGRSLAVTIREMAGLP